MKVKNYSAGILVTEDGETYTATGNGGIMQNDETGELFVVSEIKNGIPTEILPMGGMQRKFIDHECDEIIPEYDLVYNFANLKNEDPEEYAYNFADYIRNCTDKNGTLEEV